MVSKKIKPLCRRQQVQQVVMNLVTNARDALNVIDCERDRLKKNPKGIAVGRPI
jgi:signal transduction histidine kinase